MTQYAFYFDQSRCYDCKACAVACKDWNGLEPGPCKWLRMFEWEEGMLPDVRLYAMFGSCYHCEDPACVKACPEGAIFKEDKYGAVLVENEKCTGCRSCYEACPYGAPQFASDEPTEKMSKCTMCLDRLEDGKKPICVMSCPLRALDFGTLEEMRAAYPDAQEAVSQFPDPSQTHPAILFKPAEPRKQIVKLDPNACRESLLNLDEGASSDVEMTPVRGKLNMKPKNSEELLALTRNDEG